MECKKSHKWAVEFKYEFDRLGKQKMEQVYNILLSKLLQNYEKKNAQLAQGGKKQ